MATKPNKNVLPFKSMSFLNKSRSIYVLLLVIVSTGIGILYWGSDASTDSLDLSSCHEIHYTGFPNANVILTKDHVDFPKVFQLVDAAIKSDKPVKDRGEAFGRLVMYDINDSVLIDVKIHTLSFRSELISRGFDGLKIYNMSKAWFLTSPKSPP